jgi:ABC-type amino acid transport substrate-binding protein
LEGLRVAESYNTGEFLAPAYTEDNQALREAANEAFEEMKDDGTLDDAYQQWFKIEPPKAVLEKTNTPK